MDAESEHSSEYTGPRIRSEASRIVSSDVSSQFVGRSEAMERIRRSVEHAAQTDSCVLVHGETGTGKDTVARLIHVRSQARRPGVFVRLCCPALSEDRLEAELFGCERGVLGEDSKARPGRLELAHRGTAVLEAVDEASPEMQSLLLEYLSGTTLYRLGGDEAISTDARLIAISELGPEAIYASGALRGDLFFRLTEMTIEVPPLRRRPEDIPDLVQHFLKRFQAFSERPRAVGSEALSGLMEYSWPGNVRELEAAIRRFAVSGDEADLTSQFVRADDGESQPAAAKGTLYEDNERRVILAALTETRWNRRKAARILGISYNTLRRRIERYDLNNVGRGSHTPASS